MNREDAEEWTQALGQSFGGNWRQYALAIRLGVPKALGKSVDEWASEVGGYVRLAVSERKQAVGELRGEGFSLREIAGALGVSKSNVQRDAVPNGTPTPPTEPRDQVVFPGAVPNGTDPQRTKTKQKSAFDHAATHLNQLQRSIRYITDECINELDGDDAATVLLSLEELKNQVEFALITLGGRLE